MLTVCHLAEKAQNINRNTENHDHKRGITSTKLALKERSPTVASVASTTSSHTLLWACIFAKKNSALMGAWPIPQTRTTPTKKHYFSSRKCRLKSCVWLPIVLATDATVGDLSFNASFVLVMPRLWSWFSVLRLIF